jgi:hypothetical protein
MLILVRGVCLIALSALSSLRSPVAGGIVLGPNRRAPPIPRFLSFFRTSGGD